MASRKLQVEIIGDASSLNKAFSKAGQSSSRLGTAFAKLGKAAVVAGAAMAAGLAVGIVKSIDAASDLGEQLTKTGVVFGKSSKEVHKWSEGLASSFGLSQRAALEAAGTFGNMLVPMGFARKDAAGMSKDFVELAADMASFNNASPEETLMALQSGLAGQSEPLRRFGVFLNEARIKAQALEMGLYSGKGAIDAQAKAAATAAIIFKDTADTQGDFGRTSESLANQQRILKAELENSAAAIGTALMPAAVALLGVITQVIPVVTEWGTRLSEAVGPHITTAINALIPTFLNVKQAVLGFIQSARELLPTLLAIASPVFSFGVSSLGQSFGVAIVSMVAFHKVATAVNAALVQMRLAASGVGLASLISPIGLLTAGVGLLAFAFYKTKIASDDVATSIDRQRAAIDALKTATSDAAHGQQRLRDANIALKQATLDVTTALQRRNQIEKEGKKGTDEFKQAQLDVERAYSGRKRAELEVRDSNEALVTSTRKQASSLKELRTEAATSTTELGKLAANLQRSGKEAEAHVVVKRYGEEMARLAKAAHNVSEKTAESNPKLSAAAENFAKNAAAAADYAKRTKEIPPALTAAIGPVGAVGRSIGVSLGQGIQAGISSQVAGIAATAAGAVRAAETAARSEARAKSPSLLFAAIGRDMADGMAKGITERYDKLSTKAKELVDKAITAAITAIEARQGAFGTAFDKLVDEALGAFDKLHDGIRTAAERALDAFDLKQAVKAAKAQIQELKNALLVAQTELQGIQARGPEQVSRSEGETDEAFNARQLAAQEAFLRDEAAAQANAAQAFLALEAEKEAQRLAAQRAALEKRAAESRVKEDEQTARQRTALEERLANLQNNFLQGEITAAQFTARMTTILKKAGIPLQNAAEALGQRMAAGLLAAKASARHAAIELAETIKNALGNISVAVKVHVSRTDAPDADKKAAGGPVRRGMPYLVGEKGAEMFVPSASGRIIPNHRLAGAGTSGAGNVYVTVNAPNYVGTLQDLGRAVQEAAADFKRRNGGSLI